MIVKNSIWFVASICFVWVSGVISSIKTVKKTMKDLIPTWKNPKSLRCRDCWDILTFRDHQRQSGLCEDCEFDTLTPPGWENDFLEKLAAI